VPDGLVIRRATGADRPAVLRLLSATLGWLPDEHHGALFEWKHDRNPFGPSPAWVAVDEASGTIAGFRTFMRWEFERDGEIVRAVRAVDTATDPAYRGRGIFRRLTLQAVEELTSEGVEFVFNTPNDQSRPGYLKMGWEIVGRVPIRVRLRSPLATLRVLRARAPAELWSDAPTAGEEVDRLLDRGALALAPRRRDGRLRTRLDEAVLRWRYGGFPPLGYRGIVDPVSGGTAIVRLRTRGDATEAAIDDVLTVDDDPRAVAHAAVVAARASGADYAILTTARPLGRSGFVPVPRRGPILTWRALASATKPRLDQWRLVLGDVELF